MHSLTECVEIVSKVGDDIRIHFEDSGLGRRIEDCFGCYWGWHGESLIWAVFNF
jgi:hypothetical protein